MTIKEVLERTTQFFREKNISSPRLDAEILLAKALGLERIKLYLEFDRPLKDKELENCREVVRRRGLGEPVAYITGQKEFFGYSFAVTKEVLIPRPETEHLIEEVLRWVDMQGRGEGPLMILDLGCGSGCVGLSLLKRLPSARLVAMDIEAGALAVARANAENLGVAERAAFYQGDAGETKSLRLALEHWQTPVVDILVANPPYIESGDVRVEEGVKKFEPTQALFAGDKGLACLKGWSLAARPLLAKSSIMLMEMGLEQGPAMKKHFEDLKIFAHIEVVKDLAGHDRLIKGMRNG